MKLVLFFSLLIFALNAQADDCVGFKKVNGFTSDITQSCLGLVASQEDIPWVMPRKVAFLDQNTLLVSDMGGWKNKSGGSVWAINTTNLSFKKIYSGGRFTHGLAVDQHSRILIGNADKIIRISMENEAEVTLINNLPTEGSHPLTQFILLPNNDIIINIGAPSDNCEKEMGSGTHCPSRDSFGEIRRYFYNTNNDSYDSDYQVLARGLRNSMGLLYNPLENMIYQAENNMDHPGIPEELNAFSLNSDRILDFGWPFCYGFGEQAPNLNNNFSSFCQKRSDHPLFLIPPHSAPLDMIYYSGSAFTELNHTIVMGWHGHRRSQEKALVAYRLESNQSPRVTSTESNDYITILNGVNPNNGDKIRPVGITTQSNGNIWFVDDHTFKLYVFTPSQSGQGTDTGSENFFTKNKDFVNSLEPQQIENFANIYNQFKAVQTCTQCHDSNEFPADARQAIEQFLNKKWFVKDTSARDMTIMNRMDPLIESPRSMPPPPEAKPFGHDHPEIYNDLLIWLENNISQ